MPWLLRSFPPLPNGFSDYWLKIHVTVRESAYDLEPDEEPLVGYFRVLGLRCRTGTFRNLVDRLVDDGAVD